VAVACSLKLLIGPIQDINGNACLGMIEHGEKIARMFPLLARVMPGGPRTPLQAIRVYLRTLSVVRLKQLLAHCKLGRTSEPRPGAAALTCEGDVDVDSLMRLHQARHADFRRGKRLGKDDILISWKKPAQRTAAWSAQELAALPDTLTLRQIRLHLDIKGCRSRSIILVTTLLDPVAYPPEAIAALYLERWSVELHFREIKITLALDVLRCLTPAMIEKEMNLQGACSQHCRSKKDQKEMRNLPRLWISRPSTKKLCSHSPTG
jgi:Transposase DDE domain